MGHCEIVGLGKYMKKINDIKEVHSILYDTLCYLDDFCKKNKIKYFLSNGTALGAAKYGDFIPWDDDVDVLMPREDYDRLMQLADINNGKYRLLCVQQVPLWRMPYAKLSCEDTVVNEGEYNFGATFGLSVDIFPIDNWSSSALIAKCQSVESELLKRLLVCSIGGAFSTKKTGLKRFILKGIWKTGKAIGYARLQKSLLAKASKPDGKSRYAGCRVWTCHLTGEIFPSHYFEETVYLDFRNRKFPTIRYYENYLSSLYGSWREDLPLDKQHSNHEITVWYKDEE